MLDVVPEFFGYALTWNSDKLPPRQLVKCCKHIAYVTEWVEQANKSLTNTP